MNYECCDCGKVYKGELLANECCGEGSRQVSYCCGSSIGEKVYTEYPLGGQKWGINYLVPVCEKCGEELV